VKHLHLAHVNIRPEQKQIFFVVDRQNWINT